MVIEALDKDIASSDAIGTANPISFSNITQAEDPITSELELFDANYKLVGTAKITTQFIFRPNDPIPQSLNSKC